MATCTPVEIPITWIPLGRAAPDEHQFFHMSGDPQKRLFLCDNSGSTPSRCEHPLIWIDKSKPIVAMQRSFCIPVKSEDPAYTCTVSNIEEAAWLCLNHGMTLQVGDAVVKLVPTK